MYTSGFLPLLPDTEPELRKPVLQPGVKTTHVLVAYHTWPQLQHGSTLGFLHCRANNHTVCKQDVTLNLHTFYAFVQE